MFDWCDGNRPLHLCSKFMMKIGSGENETHFFRITVLSVERVKMTNIYKTLN